MPSFEVEVIKRGPIFHNPSAQVRRFLTSAQKDTADYGVTLVRARLGRVLRFPTGFYESQIQVQRQSNTFNVWDNNVVYGPWLEGTGSRNLTSRFKGYRTFRLTKIELDKQVNRIIEPQIRKLIAALNG